MIWLLIVTLSSLHRDVSKLELLQELNISGNKLTYLPSCLMQHSKLTILRANSNQIHSLPDFGKAMSLRVNTGPYTPTCQNTHVFFLRKQVQIWNNYTSDKQGLTIDFHMFHLGFSIIKWMSLCGRQDIKNLTNLLIDL